MRSLHVLWDRAAASDEWLTCCCAPGNDRLSWHLNRGVGGYRAGASTGLNFNSGYEKIIYVAPVSCDALGDDMSEFARVPHVHVAPRTHVV